MALKNKSELVLQEDRPLLIRILLFTIPIMCSGILQLLFNTADTIVVGRFAGGEALGAVGATHSLVNLLVNGLIGLSVGASVAVSHAWGAGNQDAVQETVHTAMLTAFLGGFAIMALGVFGSNYFLTWMDTPANILPLSTLYMQIYFIGLPASLVYNFGAAILRSTGDSRTPLVYLSISGVLNVLLNLLLVIVFHLSVAGVAIATVASQLVSAILIVLHLIRQKNCCQLLLKKLRIYPQRLGLIVRIGLPAGLQSMIFSMSNVIIQSSVNSFGALAVEGHALAQSLDSFIYTAQNSFYQTTLTFVGQHVGAKKHKMIGKIMTICILLVTICGLLLGTLVYVFREPLMSLYRPGATEAHKYCEIRLRFIGLPYFLCGILEILTGVLRGVGMSLCPMLTTIIGVCVTRLGWIYFIFPLNRTPEMLYASYPISWIVTILCQAIIIVYILRKRFRHNADHQLSNQ